jgi:Animal haem peroxidase
LSIEVALVHTNSGRIGALSAIVQLPTLLEILSADKEYHAVMSCHARASRGTRNASPSKNFQGRFGRLFKNLPPATYGDSDAANNTNLAGLAEAMKGGLDPAKDGNDDEESCMPALYTYLGQFIDHDLTFDPVSTLDAKSDPDALLDFRSPAFDLDNVYGRGPDDQPYLYNVDNTFVLGAPLSGTKGNTDLQRNVNGRAIIGDPRNDENKILSQLQGLFLRFHNRLIKEGKTFDEAQRLLRFHYQYMVLNDFLSRIVDQRVLAGLRGANGLFDKSALKFYPVAGKRFIPVEFSGACYRFGHSMVRPGYRMNDNDVSLLNIFRPRSDKNMSQSLTGNEPIPAELGIDWGRFIDIDCREYGTFPLPENKECISPADKKRLQLAYRIDSSIVDPLANLPLSVAGGLPVSLAERNLKRGRTYGLPSGQAVAKAMGVKPLCDSEIVIGVAADSLPGHPAKVNPSIVDPTNAKKFGYNPCVFKGNCPLWTYILAESGLNKVQEPVPAKNVTRPANALNTCKLGLVGGRIVAETFLGLMFQDKYSYLNSDPSWTPTSGNTYKFKDFVSFALGTTN